MKDNKIIILHTFQDGLIFSAVADSYDALPDVENLYLFYAPDRDHKMQNLKDARVKIINNFKEYTSYFSNPEIDVILFYSLPYHYYYLFDYIDDRKFVIWWAWGYDIYYKQGKFPPLIPLDEMYMPLTKQYMLNHQKTSLSDKIHYAIPKIKYPLKWIIRNVFGVAINLPQKSQKEIIARIDAFYAPLDIEYDLMKDSQPTFRAIRNPRMHRKKDYELVLKTVPGNVLINHSLTYTDNHLDVFEYLRDVKIDMERKYILPVSYGLDGFNENPENLINVSCLNESQTIWLTKVLSLEEYNKVMDSSTHAIYGTLRQQALGNILRCFLKGIKVFMFEKSILYKDLKKKGYKIFTIEKDLTSESLSTCLSESEAMHNFDLYAKRFSQSTILQYRDYLEEQVTSKKKSNVIHN